MAIILGANSAAVTGYDVANSCRFNDGDSPMMQLTPGSSATDSKKMTISFWCKLGALGTDRRVFSASNAGDDGRDTIFFTNEDKLYLFLNQGNPGNLRTNRLFRDVGAWYHIVIAIDTTQSTDTNRVKFYVNGIQETSFDTGGDGIIWPVEDYDIVGFGQNGRENTIGADTDGGGNDNEFDGYLAEFVFIDGLQLAPTSFGEFDEDSPTIWKPIDVSGLTFGTNGFYLDFEASDNLGNDANGGTDFTETNLAATDQSADSPTNNWCTWNGTLKSMSTMALSEGNLQGATSSSHEAYFGSFFSSIGMTAGKWYAEFKATSDANQSLVGISSNLESDVLGSSGSAYHFAYKGNGWGYYGNDGKVAHTDSNTWLTYGDSLADNDIVGVALDLDNLELYFSKNGTWQNSGDPTSGASKTGGVVNGGAKALDGSGSTGTWYFCCADNSQSEVCTWQANFGNPIHSISSGNADADGYGNFEYAVPSGYYALNTKNLGAYGG